MVTVSGGGVAMIRPASQRDINVLISKRNVVAPLIEMLKAHVCIYHLSSDRTFVRMRDVNIFRIIVRLCL